jgi:oligopeptide/dipeptide ABC transporter ATP-binding protein
MNYTLIIKNLKVYFPVTHKSQILKAVDNVSLKLQKAKTLGLVGESGCGKTTLGQTIMGVYPNANGDITFQTNNKTFSLLKLHKKEKKYIHQKIQIIFQDPYSALNPKLTVNKIIQEGMIIHNLRRNEKEREKEVINLLEQVGLPPNSREKYPHEFSGGQRQRIIIARALAVKPDILICDEAVSSLDIDIRNQILTLLQHLQKEHQLSYIFISHDLSVIKNIADNVAVMYLGKIVEYGQKNSIFSNPLHPYTKALLSSIPGQSKKNRIILDGDIPSPTDPPSGCYFHPRCYMVKKECQRWEFSETKVDNNHSVCCILM